MILLCQFSVGTLDRSLRLHSGLRQGLHNNLSSVSAIILSLSNLQKLFLHTNTHEQDNTLCGAAFCPRVFVHAAAFTAYFLFLHFMADDLPLISICICFCRLIVYLAVISVNYIISSSGASCTCILLRSYPDLPALCACLALSLLIHLLRTASVLRSSDLPCQISAASMSASEISALVSSSVNNCFQSINLLLYCCFVGSINLVSSLFQ